MSGSKKRKTIPHLFGKLVVGWCILCATAASFYAMRILSSTGHDPATLLGVVLGFFGGELLFMCLRAILGEKGKRHEQNQLETETDEP